MLAHAAQFTGTVNADVIRELGQVAPRLIVEDATAANDALASAQTSKGKDGAQ